MVRVRALVKCFPNNMLRQEGEEFDHTGEINPDVMIALVDEEPTKLPKKTKVKKTAVPKASADAPVQGLPNAIQGDLPIPEQEGT